MQLQAMNEMMQGQFEAYSITSVMILGIAGGNGLEDYQINELSLEQATLEMNYRKIGIFDHMLPNGEKLVQIDFEK